MENGKYSFVRRSIKVHLVDYWANVPGHVSALPSSVSHLPHDDDQCVMAEKSESIEAETIRVTTLQLDLEEIKNDFPKILVKSVFGWVTEVCPDEETEPNQAPITQTELIEPSSPMKQVAVSSSPSVLRQLNFTEILGSLNTQSLESIASSASRQGRQVKLRPPLVDSLVSLMRPLRAELELMEFVFAPAKLHLISLPALVTMKDGGYSFLRRRVKVYLIDYCAKKPKDVEALPSSVCKLPHDGYQCLVGETLLEATDFAQHDTGFTNTESGFSHLENDQGEGTKPKQRENTNGDYVTQTALAAELPDKDISNMADAMNSISQTTSMKVKPSDTIQIGADDTTLLYKDESKMTTVEEKVIDLSLQCAPQMTESLEKEEYLSTAYPLNITLESSGTEGQQLEITGEEAEVSINSLSTDIGVSLTPNEWMDQELPSDHTPPIATNDVDTGKGDQKLLHECSQAQKKEAKRKKQRPKSSRRRSQKENKGCPKKESESEHTVEGRKYTLQNAKTEVRLDDNDAINPKHNTSVTESPDEGRDDISPQTRGVTGHKTSTTYEAGSGIVNVEGKHKESDKLNPQTKHNKTRKTSNKIDAAADQLSVQSAESNVRESEKAKRKETLSVEKPVASKRQETAPHRLKKKPCVESGDVLIISTHKSIAPPSGINESGRRVNEAVLSKRPKKVKHRNNADDLPRKGHASGVMARSNTSSSTRMGSYSTAAQKGSGTKAYEQDGPRSINSFVLRDEGMNCYSRLLVKANMDQGDGRLLIPGVQCCSIALCAILRATGKSPLMWTPEDIDDIIINGIGDTGRHNRGWVSLKVPISILMRWKKR
ncbi:uncharacterized protein LOC116618255 [Nematostella vectensis]|uniref:uncharacterized protein LOC116618255 n=1 Tax=Nematostella vectensis TaxID=45351 RepID=UPI0020770F73|nr:uncharacterized protein LOC116618255 [Nematostella vectensis]